MEKDKNIHEFCERLFLAVYGEEDKEFVRQKVVDLENFDDNVLNAFARLSPLEQDVMRLRLSKKQSYGKIAWELKISKDKARVTYTHGLLKMKHASAREIMIGESRATSQKKTEIPNETESWTMERELADLDISVRLHNALLQNGLSTVGELFARLGELGETREERAKTAQRRIKILRNIGERSANELVGALDNRGYFFDKI